MSRLVFCFLIGAFIVSCESVRQYYFVIAPNVIRFDNEETVTVSLLGSDLNVAVTVWLEHGDKQISTKKVTVPDEKNPVNTTLRVTEADLFHGDIGEKPRYIRLCSRRELENSICRDLVLSYKAGYLIIQTNKPIYTPLQRVEIRVLALDESLKTVSGDKWQLSLEIVSPSNLTLGKKVFSKATGRVFYRNVFTLPPYPEIGMWTARAFYMGQSETVSRALFQVEEYVTPTFGVSVDVSEPYILQGSFTDETITITVRATYVYGKPVKGTVRISLNITDSMGDSQYILERDRKPLENGIGEFSVKFCDILASEALKDKTFPDSSRLLSVATVFESATGKEESSFHDDTVFATKPYIFQFTRSKRHFRPGMEYFVKVDMFTPNKQPASRKTIKVQKMDEFHQLLEEEEVRTDHTGQALAIFRSPNKKFLKFKVIHVGPKSIQESQILEVTAYDDKNQIQVEQIIIDGNVMLVKAFSNIQLDRSGNAKAWYTGMLFVVVSRGNVVHTVFKPASNTASEQIKEDLQELISPAARLLVFYVDEQTDKVVADSIKIEVDHKCRGDGLTLKPGNFEALPGAGDTLSIAGTPYMWVGLNVMDKALLLHSDRNIMTKNKMFDVLKSHDLGCGEGSGKNNGDVFKNAGLTILTNARIESDVERVSEDCDTNVRKKRAVDDKTQMASESLNEISQYESDLERLAQHGIRPQKRTDFRESFLFEELKLNVDGEAEKAYTYPDSLTDWMIQAIGITENKGICVANPVDVRVRRQFFIQLDLPYRATRLEMFYVKATLFNYGQENDTAKQVHMYLEGVESLCYDSEAGQPSPTKYVEISPNSARTVKFPMVPLKAGRFPIKVTAIVTNPFGKFDIIEKELFVVNEGIQEVRTIQVCLDPNEKRKDCESHKRVETQYAENEHSGGREQMSTVDLTLPKIALPNTGSATAYIQGNIMDNVVTIILSGVESLFRHPFGCGEYTIATTAPNVYAMMYLKQTEQVTSDIEVTGHKYIRNGVNRAKTMFRHSDGSYSCCNNDKYSRSYRPTSVWLTAFALKVFCHANSVVDDVLDEKADLHQTIEFLNNHINARGEFVEIMGTTFGSWLKGATEKSSTSSLTAFVLISLLECNSLRTSIKQTVELATKYLENLDENWLKDRPFDLAISTYALALAKSNETDKFKKWLHSIERRNGKNIYWGISDSGPANAYSVETTAYALLAMQQFNDMDTSAYIVRWLTSQQDSRGVFRSTQDDLSMALLPEKWIASGYRALKSTGNGNCLYNSCSMALCGNESLTADLRHAVADELQTNPTRYRKDHVLVKRFIQEKNLSPDEICMLFHIVLSNTDDESLSTLTIDNIEEYIRAEGLQSFEDRRWSSILLMMALSTVLGRDMESVYPDIMRNYQGLYNTNMEPAGDKSFHFPENVSISKEKITLFWTRDGNLSQTDHMFVPNHIVPLVLNASDITIVGTSTKRKRQTKLDSFCFPTCAKKQSTNNNPMKPVNTNNVSPVSSPSSIMNFPGPEDDATSDITSVSSIENTHFTPENLTDIDYRLEEDSSDTVVGLQALSEYSIRTYSKEIDLTVSMYANDWSGKQLAVKTEKSKFQQIVDKLPVERGDNKMTVVVNGTSGSGRMRIDLRYNRAAKDDEICPFHMSDIKVDKVYKYPKDQHIARLRQCDVCGECTGDHDRDGYNIVNKMKCARFSVSAKEGHQHGMSKIYFNLETGVTVLREDMEKLMVENENLYDFEMPSNGNGFVVFYLNKITSHKNTFVFRLVDNFDGDINSRQPVSVDVFDYYNPDQYCRKIYGTGPNTDISVDYRCDSKKAHCKCLQSACAKPVVEKKITKLVKLMKKKSTKNKTTPPDMQLLHYTCNPENANFAVYVEVKQVWPDIDTKNEMAMAVVVRSIHQGAIEHKRKDELIFYWKKGCSHPTLKVGKRYYIIAKDGHKVDTENGQSEYHYPLMGSAVVIQPTSMIRPMLMDYENVSKNENCLQ